MRTFIKVDTQYNPPKKFCGMTISRDKIIFDNLLEVQRFIDGEVCFDALDSTVKLADGEEVVKITCILAEDYTAAMNR